MSRRIPDDRFADLVRTATAVFIAQGYRRTQMADVAEALGVAKGTLYLYVEGKEALFDLVVRSAGATDEHPVEVPATLPVPTPKAGATLAFAGARLAEGASLPTLAAALATHETTDAPGELEAIFRELYRTLSANRISIKLVDAASRDFPELAKLWFESGREGVLDLLSRYFDDRIQRGYLRTMPDVRVAARMALETTVFWAVHRHWDPHPQTVEETVSEETVVRFVVNAFAKQ